MTTELLCCAALQGREGGDAAASAAYANLCKQMPSPTVEESSRADAQLRRMQTLALSMVVTGELMRIFRRPIYALALRRYEPCRVLG